MMQTLTVQMYSRLTGLSIRTVRRYVAKELVGRVGYDGRGRLLIKWPLDDICVKSWTIEELSIIAEADAGEPSALGELGAALYVRGLYKNAYKCFLEAAQLRNRDAMNWLAICYSTGNGIAKNERLAIDWLRRAAALNHRIAQMQVSNLGLCDWPLGNCAINHGAKCF